MRWYPHSYRRSRRYELWDPHVSHIRYLAPGKAEFSAGSEYAANLVLAAGRRRRWDDAEASGGENPVSPSLP